MLYDYKVDEEIPIGKTLIFFEDGTKILVSTKSLEVKDGDIRATGLDRNRFTKPAGNREVYPRYAKERKRLPIRKAHKQS